jgi:S1-C subfamily serine protease
VNNNRPSLAWRLWLLIAQVIAVSAGLLIAWRAFGPEPVAPARTDVVALARGAARRHVGVGAKWQGRHDTPRGRLSRGGGQGLGLGRQHLHAQGTATTVARLAAALWRLRRGGARRASPAWAPASIVAAQGFILTNNHVVEGADEIAVMPPGGKVAEARVVGTDPETDLAVLRVEAKGLQPITFADPASVQIGDIVLAVGDPFGVGQTVTQGIVSATGRNRLGINTFENFIQTDAAINPGNSGGALVDASGHLVGINTAIYSRSGGSQGIGFAIPVSLARQVMEQIIATGRVSRGWLGVSARDVIHETTGAAAGAALVAVQRGGPAERAGLARAGDTVLSINGKEVVDTAALINETAALSPGTQGAVQDPARPRGQSPWWSNWADARSRASQ